jgi:hypothetical protein
VDKE